MCLFRDNISIPELNHTMSKIKILILIIYLLIIIYKNRFVLSESLRVSKSV